jgi:hypothetical protein
MPVPVLGHVPELYAVGSAVLALLYWAVKVATGSIFTTSWMPSATCVSSAAERDETGEAG